MAARCRRFSSPSEHTIAYVTDALYSRIISKICKRYASIKHIRFTTPTGQEITTKRLSEIASDEIVTHMSNPRIAEHLPLLTFEWNDDSVTQFIAAKEAYWTRDKLGHWAFLCNGTYAGWGGFQKEGDEWDFGLVLKPEYFGLGIPITKAAITFAKLDDHIPYITFLLPPSRRHIGAIVRLGAQLLGEIEYAGTLFRKYRMDS